MKKGLVLQDGAMLRCFEQVGEDNLSVNPDTTNEMKKTKSMLLG